MKSRIVAFLQLLLRENWYHLNKWGDEQGINGYFS